MEFAQRKHPRLKAYDYSQQGCYFVTLCTQNKCAWLSRISGGSASAQKLPPAGDSVGRGLAPAGDSVGRGLPPAGDSVGRGLAPAGDSVGRGLAPAGDSAGRGLAPAATACIQLTPMGEVLERELLALSDRYSCMSIDKYVIMPTHLHVIIRLEGVAAGSGAIPTPVTEEGGGKGSVEKEYCNGKRSRETNEPDGKSSRPTLMDIICTLKSLTARACNQNDLAIGRKIWQASFYEKVIRDEKAYAEIWQYIETNPLKWEEDEYYSPFS